MEENAQVSTYVANAEAKRQSTLNDLRALVRSSVPGVVETMDYNMPTYVDSKGNVICAFASQKNYISFYMTDTDIVEKHKSSLQGLNCGKSCIRFKGSKDAPMEALRQMLEVSAASRR